MSDRAYFLLRCAAAAELLALVAAIITKMP
jgi:hypothetical protein